MEPRARARGSRPRLIAPRNHPEMRRRGCIWLGLFPSRETVAALGAIARSPDEPRPLRDQAIWTLGYRQIQNRHDALFWALDVVALADAALVEIARIPANALRVDPELAPREAPRLRLADARGTARRGRGPPRGQPPRRRDRPTQVEILEHWRRDPSLFAQCYAREGYFRGDLGRVVEGLSAVSPHASFGFEAFALMRAFVALGRPEHARWAWAHLEARPKTHFAATRLEAARALLLAGDLERAMREVLGVALRHPLHGYETTIHRLLRQSVSNERQHREAAPRGASSGRRVRGARRGHRVRRQGLAGGAPRRDRAALERGEGRRPDRLEILQLAGLRRAPEGEPRARDSVLPVVQCAGTGQPRAVAQPRHRLCAAGRRVRSGPRLRALRRRDRRGEARRARAVPGEAHEGGARVLDYISRWFTREGDFRRVIAERGSRPSGPFATPRSSRASSATKRRTTFPSPRERAPRRSACSRTRRGRRRCRRCSPAPRRSGSARMRSSRSIRLRLSATA